MSGLESNRAYYEQLQPGRRDYWRYMAAPRHRVATILRLIEQSPSSSLIDLGCGNGQLLDEIARRFPQMKLAGIDLSENQLQENRERHPSIAWMAADLQKPVEASDRFDVVVASEIIEHLDQPEALLRNAALLARPGGMLILTTQSGTIRETERRVGHIRHFDAATLDAMLRATSWTPRRIWNDGFPFHDLSKWWANRDAGSSMKQFGENAYGTKERLICALLRLAFRFNSRTRGAQLFALAGKR
ncbi:MAG: class I SAM-dependent methyltransferase [Thermoanaerobaculia bacterium]